jgi:Helix-turn-helix
MAYQNSFYIIVFWNKNMAKHIYTDNRRQLSTKLIEARETANLTQKQVADSGVLSQSELSKIEVSIIFFKNINKHFVR